MSKGNLVFGPLLAGVLLSLAYVLPFPALASTLDSEAEGATRHRESGWLFPAKIGAFERTGAPEAVARTEDVAANYVAGAGDRRMAATIYVYPANSPALDASYEGANRVISAANRGALNQLWSDGPFIIGNNRKLLGQKAFYKLGLGPDSSLTNLYFFDTGKWVVKVRVSAERVQEDTLKVADEFVRALPWESLRLDDLSCSGFACSPARPMAIHGLIPEMLAQMLAGKVDGLASESAFDCDPDQVVTAIAAPPKAAQNGKPLPPVEMVHACRVNERRVNFVRFVLPDEIRTKLADSPDGLTLRGPLSFAVVRDKQGIHYSELHDGLVDPAIVRAILARISNNRQVDFANGPNAGEKLSPVIRFLQ